MADYARGMGPGPEQPLPPIENFRRLIAQAEKGQLPIDEAVAFESIAKSLFSRQDLTPEWRELAKGGFKISAPIDVDRTTGAPMNVRALAGEQEYRPQDMLATVQQYFPDAQLAPPGSWGYGDNNIIYTDPQTGRPTLFNPKGIEPGSIAGYGATGAETAGSTIGEFVGPAVGSALGPAGKLGGLVLGPAIGAVLAREGYDLARRKAGQVDTRSTPEHLLDAGITGVTNAGIVPAVQLASKFTKGAINKLTGPLRNRLAGKGADALLQDFGQAGVDMLPSATGSRFLQGGAEYFEKTPGGAGPAQRIAGQAEQQTVDLNKRVAGQFGVPAATEGQAGEVMARGYRGAQKRFTDNAKKAYDRLYAYVPQDTMVKADNALSVLDSLVKKYEKTPGLQKEFVGEVIELQNIIKSDLAATGTLPFETLQDVRSQIGERLKPTWKTSGKGLSDTQNRALYAALSKDIEAAAATGGPDAVRAFHVANRYFRQGLKEVDFIDMTLKKIDKAGGEDRIYQDLMGATKASGGATDRLMRHLAPQEKEVVTATIVDRMGRATKGAQGAEGDTWSASTFLTRWNDMKPEAKDVLFGKTKYAAARPNLDQLARIVAAQKDAIALKNTSNTGLINNWTQQLMAPLGAAMGAVASTGMGAGSGTALMAAIGSAVGTFGLQHVAVEKLFMSPKFTRWLVQGSKLNPAEPGAWMNHVSRLALITQAEPEIKEEVNQYYNALMSMIKPAKRAGGE